MCKTNPTFSEEAIYNLYVFSSGQLSGVGAGFSFRHVHVETAVECFPVVCHIAGRVMKRHGDGRKYQSVLLVNIAFLNQFAAINCVVVGQKERVVGESEKPFRPLYGLPQMIVGSDATDEHPHLSTVLRITFDKLF